MKRLTRLVATVAAACAALFCAGCATTDLRSQTMKEVQPLQLGPSAPPYRTITGFSDALRCMDHLMISYGVRDWPVLVEDLTDHTKKINAGTKDMLISAMSDLGKRSRAIRLVTFGSDSGNLANFHANAESKRPYESLPLYDIRGSVSQLDEGLFKKQIEGGITLGPVGIGAAKSADASVLAIDLTVISAQDYAVIPGVTSRNSVIIYKEGAGVDGEAEYKKLGLNFGMTLTRAEGRAQALRTLVELSVVELVGRLTHTPYWSCLGADAQSPQVTTEIADWYYAMATSGELTAWMQRQLMVRGLYRGELDGRPSAAFDAAVTRYRQELGLDAKPLLDEAFFAAYLRAQHKQVDYAAVLGQRAGAAATTAAPAMSKTAAAAPAEAPKAAQAAQTAQAAQAAQPTQATQAAPGAKSAAGGQGAPAGASSAAVGATTAPAADAAAPLKLSIANAGAAMRSGQPLELRVAPSRDAFLMCYLQDAAGAIQRFYPNRFSAEPMVRAKAPLLLPGSGRYQLLVPAVGSRETVACFASDKSLQAQLDPALVGRDFEPLRVASLRQLQDAFAQASGGQFAQEIFHVQAR